jgi:hypothetical protein
MVPCYVIHLGDDFQNRESLEDFGLNPIGFKGVDARKDEHLKYSENVDTLCQYTCPKSTIGCALSHILLAQKLYDEGVPIALVLEDDAYPKVPHIDVNEILENIPSDWEIIKLHCVPYCNESIHVWVTDDSNAAYLRNRKGIDKVRKLKAKLHIDYHYNIANIKMYKYKNVFMTDESTSNIRESQKPHWFSYFIPTPTSGEQKREHFFMYKIFRIPGTTVEVTIGRLIDVLCIALIGFLIHKSLNFRKTKT